MSTTAVSAPSAPDLAKPAGAGASSSGPKDLFAVLVGMVGAGQEPTEPPARPVHGKTESSRGKLKDKPDVAEVKADAEAEGADDASDPPVADAAPAAQPTAEPAVVVPAPTVAVAAPPPPPNAPETVAPSQPVAAASVDMPMPVTAPGPAEGAPAPTGDLAEGAAPAAAPQTAPTLDLASGGSEVVRPFAPASPPRESAPIAQAAPSAISDAAEPIPASVEPQPPAQPVAVAAAGSPPGVVMSDVAAEALPSVQPVVAKPVAAAKPATVARPVAGRAGAEALAGATEVATTAAATAAGPAPTGTVDATLDAETLYVPAETDGEAAAPADDVSAAPEAPPTAAGSSAPASQPGSSGPTPTAGTVTHLAAQIVRRLEGRTSRFEVQLDPDGLGQVNVQVQIDARGRLSAAMSFDRPESAEAMKARAGELRAALEKSGFDLSGAGLSFDSGGDGGGLAGDSGAGRDQAFSAPQRGRAFGAAAEAAEQADLALGAALRRQAAGGLDIRI